MIVCYLAGPYTAPTDEERAENVRRVGNICRWLTRTGYAVVTIHAAIHAGHYGDDGNDEDRERGLKADEAIVSLLGELWPATRFFALSRDDGTLSSGTAREVAAFGEHAICMTWAEWLASGVEP